MKILLTGATGGIGSAFASLAARAGHTLVLASRSQAALSALAARLPGDGHAVFPVDLADRDGMEGEMAALFRDLGPFGAVVHCAGDCPVVPARLGILERFERERLLHAGAFALAVKELAADRRDPGPKRAVAVSSVSAVEGWAGGSVYCAAKGALSAMARALDRELAPKVRVSAIEPGHVDTEMFRQGAMRMGVPASAARKPESVAAELLAAISL